jgi:hypothetical protein
LKVRPLLRFTAAAEKAPDWRSDDYKFMQVQSEIFTAMPSGSAMSPTLKAVPSFL